MNDTLKQIGSTGIVPVVVLNKVNTESKYMDRVKLGFRRVLDSGTGYGYIDLAYKPAGKTGTSESFIDTNNDGVYEKEASQKRIANK